MQEYQFLLEIDDEGGFYLSQERIKRTLTRYIYCTRPTSLALSCISSVLRLRRDQHDFIIASMIQGYERPCLCLE